MKKLGAVFLLTFSAFAAGTVTQNAAQVGNNGVYAITFNWTGDSSTGSVPATAAILPAPIQGYRIIVMEAAPGSPAPTNNYTITLTDFAGVDILAGSGAGQSATTAASVSASPSAPPIYGTFTFALTGNSVASAKGTAIVYLAPLSQVYGLTPTTPSFSSQGPNLVYASPNGSSGAPNFRSLVAADIPTLGYVQLAGDLGNTAASPQVTNGAHITNSSIPNSGLANPSMTVNGVTCTLGASCSTGNTLPSATAQDFYLRTKPNSGNLTTYDFAPQVLVNSADFNYTLTPGGSLTGGGGPQTVTLSICPVGIYRADNTSWASVYLSGGTGTAEAVKPSGGTCSASTQGQTGGTIVISPANNHTGAWTVTSATSGLQEAINAQGNATRATIVIPGGDGTATKPYTYLYAPVVIDSSYISVAGEGINTSLLRCDFQGDCLTISNPSDATTSVSNLRFISDIARTSGAYLHIFNATLFRGWQLYGFGSAVGVELEQVNNPRLSDVEFVSYSQEGIWVKSGATAVGCEFNNVGAGGGTDLVSSVGLLLEADTGGAIAGCEITNFTSQVGAYGISLYAAGGVVNEVTIYNAILDSLSAGDIRMLAVGGGSGNGIAIHGGRFGGSASAPLISIPAVFTNVEVSEMTGSTTGGIAINCQGCKNASFVHNHIGGSGSSSDIGILVTDNGSGTGASYVLIADNIIGLSEAGATTGSICYYGIAVSSTGAPSSLTIRNNTLFGAQYGLFWNAPNTGIVELTGNHIAGTVAPASFTNTPASGSLLANNVGLDNISGTVADAATLAFPINSYFTLTGTGTAVTSITGVWPGRQGRFVATNAAPPQFTAGGNIGNTFTPTQNKPVSYVVDGAGTVWLQ